MTGRAPDVAGRFRHGVVIIGAGIGGLTAALALQRAGIPVRVYEKATELGEVGAGLSLGPNATRILIALGLGDDLDRICNRPEGFAGKDYVTGRIISESKAVDYVAKFGAPYFQVHRADLHRVLIDAVTATDPGAIKLGHDLIEVGESGSEVEAVFADRPRVLGDAVIGCDGIKSAVRRKVWDPEQPKFLGFVAYRGLTAAADLPPGLIVPSSGTFHGPERHFTRYLIRGGAIVNYVAFAECGDWADEGWSVPADVNEVLSTFSGWAPEIQEIVRNTLPGRCHKWGLFGRDTLPKWTRGRITLLGDAAHPMLPFLGQGASMAIEDAMILARALADSADAATGLERYDQARRPRANAVVEQSRAQADRIHRKPLPGTTVAQTMRSDLFAYDALTESL